MGKYSKISKNGINSPKIKINSWELPNCQNFGMSILGQPLDVTVWNTTSTTFGTS